jgi:hypothetical protein
MGQDEIHFLTVFAKYVLFPVIGFFAGFATQWFLQERKSRSELVQALASQRAEELRKLWAITTLPSQITVLESGVTVPSNLREQANAQIIEWYTQNGGALFLSWEATQLVFQLLDTLRNERCQKNHLEKAVSALRTRLKYDCGMYSLWEVKAQIKRPRPSPWMGHAIDANAPVSERQES